MVNNIQYYIICHDQDIVLSHSLNDYPYTWIFVGTKDKSKLDKLRNVVIASELLDNIESMSNLCSFTGWYAVYRNLQKFISGPISLLEYDILGPNIDLYTKKSLSDQYTKDVFGYKCIKCGYLIFTKSTPWLEIGLHKIYNINLQKIFPNLPTTWMSSTNICFKKPQIFYDFMDWFMPLAKFCADKPMGGYVHERALHIFLHLYYPNVIGCINNDPNDSPIVHQEQRSHKQQDVCDICKKMIGEGSTHNCIKWLYKNLYERYI